MGVLTKSDILKIKEIDQKVKNKFSFAWLERTVEIASGLKVSLGDDISKTDDAGQAVCKLCNKYINYGSRGAVALDDHVKSAKHIGLVKQRQSSHKIKELFEQQKEGAGEDVPRDKLPTSDITSKLVPMCDRISNAEVNIIFYILLGMGKVVL